MTTPDPTALTVAAIRFTDDVPRMRTFLETLGLSVGTTSGSDWAVLQAGAGQVWLHSAATSDGGHDTGTTLLTGEVADLDAFAHRLRDHRLSPVVVDEAFGRSLEVTDPLGSTVVVNERQRDTYGYESHQPQPDPRVTVSVCRFTDPTGGYVGFVEALGLRPDGPGDEWYAPFTSGDGVVGLHHDDGTHRLGSDPSDAAVALNLLVDGNLSDVQARLVAAGHEPGRIVIESFGSHLETTDPDGQPLQIHQR